MHKTISLPPPMLPWLAILHGLANGGVDTDVLLEGDQTMLMSSTKKITRTILVNIFLAVVCIGSLIAAFTVHAASEQGSGSFSDPNIKYVGRWDTTSSSTFYTSNWPAAYFKTNFTGKTVRIKSASAANIYVSIDGGDDILYIN